MLRTVFAAAGVGVPCAVWGYISNYNGFDFAMEKGYVEPYQAVLASAFVGCVVGGAGALFGVLVVQWVAWPLSKRKPPQ
jgi:hypothetical protein